MSGYYIFSTIATIYILDKGDRLEILHWTGSLSSMRVDKFNDFILIDGTHKTNIYNLSLIITTTVDSLGISVPVGFC